MSKRNLVAIECGEPESDSHAAFAQLLGVKTAGRFRQLFHEALDQRRFSAAWTPREQDLAGHTEKSNSEGYSRARMRRKNRWGRCERFL